MSKPTLTPVLILSSLLLSLASLACLTSNIGPSGQAAAVPTRTLSPQAWAIATINAAPARPVAASVEVATAELSPEALRGQELFTSSCASCHGPDGAGVLGLGKTITESEFVASMNDDDLFHFLTVGREAWDPMNTSGITMPARGGNAALTDDNLRDIVQYMRVLNAAMAPAESSTGGSSEASAAGEVAAAPSSPVVVDDALAEQGAGLFAASCASCHGPDGAGVLGLGKNLVESEFVATMGDAELAQFIIVGREIWDPMNTSGLAMPARGGNAALTDDDIAAIVQHIRTLQQ